jgi:hypothetical protein
VGRPARRASVLRVVRCSSSTTAARLDESTPGVLRGDRLANASRLRWSGYSAAMSPVAKRIMFAWIATDMIWASLFIYVLKREQD